MKRILIFLLAGLLGGNCFVRAQDASAIADRQAAEENYQKLAGKVEDLVAANDVLQKRITQLEADLKAARDDQAKPNPDVVGRDELKQLAEKVKEIDTKREADKALILDQIKQLAQAPVFPSGPTTKKHKKTAPDVTAADPTTDLTAPVAGGGDKNYEGYEYVIKDGDTLSKIVAAYREQGVKVTTTQILKHPLNAKVDANKLKVGQKIFIPAPAAAK